MLRKMETVLTAKEVEEIKYLIKRGFDIQLISFELDIPLEEVKQYELDVKNSRTIYTAKEIIDIKNQHAHSKISQMRKKYIQLYFRSNVVEGNEQEQLSQQDLEIIRSVIKKVQETIGKMQSLPKKEKREIADSILIELKKIEKYQLPLQEAEQIHVLMCSTELQGLRIDAKDYIDYNIRKQKRTSAKQLAKAIEYEQYNIDTIEELQILDEKITGSMVRENPISVGTVKTNIENRITAIRQQQTIDNIRNNIPISIISVISDLANGDIDIQGANSIINEEARKRVESKPKTRFSLSEEQERSQILVQMRTAIKEKADKFSIRDPEKTILLIQELCGDKLEQSIRAVVENLIARKEFETAKSICHKFSRQSKDEDLKYIRSLKKEIRNAEISNIVMKAINMNGTIEEERAYFDLIEKGLKMGNVNLSAISLGKSKDGVKSITLADIWTESKEPVFKNVDKQL